MDIPKVAVVGGGLSGIAAALQIQDLLPASDVTLIEASGRVGGVIQSESCDGFLIEHSADMFTTKPDDALKFCKRIGIDSELVSTRPVKQRASVFHDNRLHPVPQGFSLMAANQIWPILTSDLLTAKGKTEIIREISKRPGRVPDDESLRSFAIRRYGPEVFERLIQPLVSGIYSADPELLSMRATLPRFLDMERDFGSLGRAARSTVASRIEQSASGARYDLFRAPKQGMQFMIDAAMKQLQNATVISDFSVNTIHRKEHKWSIQSSGKPEILVDGVIVATPSRIASRLISDFDKSLSNCLGNIEYASLVIVVMGISKSDFHHKFDGFGVIQPSHPGQPFVACSMSSNKFEGRSPDNQLLLRCFFGGAMNPEVSKYPDGEMLKMAISKLREVFGYEGKPSLTRVIRWNHCSPQYHVGHLERIERIDSQVEKWPGIELAGSSYRGVGIPHCIRSGQSAARRLVKSL